MKTLYALVWRNLNASRSRTILSLLAVVLGVASTIAVSIVGESLRRGLLGNDKTGEVHVMASGLLELIDPFLTFIGLVIMFAAGFLIYNAFAMSVTQRGQQIGALRSLGMTRGQVWRITLAEALFIGTAGTLIGGVGGPLLGKAMLLLMNALLGALFVFEEAPPQAFNVALALSLGIGVTLLAMLFPARRAMRVSPLVALASPESAAVEPTSRRWAWLGLAIMALLMGYLLIDPPGRWVTTPTDGRLAVIFVGVWLLVQVLILPALIGFIGSRARPPLARLFHATGRLVADNLQRGRSRVALTVFTTAIAIMVLTGLTGLMSFFANDLFRATLRSLSERQVLYVSRFDPAAGWTAALGKKQATFMLAEEELAAVQEVAGARAVVAPDYMVISPELSSMGGSFFSNLVDPEALYRLGSAFFTFIKGSWETAMPILRKGCGVLIMPMIAERNNVGLADTFKVTYPGGSIDCTVAGIGTPAASLSLISKTDGVDFGVKQPFFVFLLPNLGVDPNQLMADLQARLPGLVMNNFAVFNNAWDQAFSLISTSMNALLMLALLAAAMGVVNTTMMSVIERRRELGLLRAIGATRRQTRAVIVGEAALMGLVGGIVGLLAGLGFTVIFVVTYGGNAWGNNNLALWPTALKSAQAAFWVGFVGIIAAPLISAAAAWIPARRILRQNPIEALALE